MKNAKGITLSTKEVEEILNRKTQFRSVVKFKNHLSKDVALCIDGNFRACDEIGIVTEDIKSEHKAGDILRIVKEVDCIGDCNMGIPCQSCGSSQGIGTIQEDTDIFQKVAATRVERLQDIKTSDMLKMGVSEFKNYNEFRDRFSPHDTKEFVNGMFKIKEQFIEKWNSEHKEGEKWEDNPFVIVEDRERVEL